MKKWILCFSSLCCFHSIQAQNAADAIAENTKVKKRDTARQMDLGDLSKRLLHIKAQPIEKQAGKKVYFTLLPLELTPPGGGTALVTSTNAGFYLGNRKTTYLSIASFAPYWNLQNQFGLPLRSNLWLEGNGWNIQGDTRFLYYPEFTWGLGDRNTTGLKKLVDYKYIRFYQSGLRRIKPYLYVGGGYAMDYHIRIKTADSGLSNFSGYDFGTAEGSNSFSSGLSLNLLYDHRYMLSKLLPFSYLSFVYRINPTWTGNRNSWSSVYIDVRKYLHFNLEASNQNTLAFRTFLWSSFGGGVPYLDLPSIGWDFYERSGRGIEQNRYRGEALAYLESEYRRDVTRNGLLGFVVFGNVNSVSDPATHSFGAAHPALGAGLRVKVNKATMTNLAIDYGVSEAYSGFWFALGESF